MKERSLLLPVRLLFIFIVLGLIYTQLIRYPYYSRLSRDNAIRIIPVDGPRGTIFDRNGVVLVTDRISFDVAVVYQELKNREKLVRLLMGMLKVGRRDIEDALENAASRPYAPVTIVEDIDKEKAFTLEEESFDIRGLVIQTKSVRNYIYKNVGAHVFGYLSEVSEEELLALKEYGYRMRDLVGRDGIEKYYDKYLAGTDGGLQIQVDNKGRQVRTLGVKEPVKGKDLHLTIDINLQAICDKALDGKAGAAIIMDPNTGEILALSSAPGFDPNIFIRSEDSSDRMKLMKDRREYPLFNRAVSGIYPPGSVFKVVIASAALETNRISRNTIFNCSGLYTLGNARFACWKEGGHGPQNVVEALMNSCNVFFYNTGRVLGVDNIEHFARLFSFGRRTGLDLPDEAKGIVPGRLWKKAIKKDTWYEGDTINYSIGQGYLLVTPIQVLEMMAVMANKGSIVTPYIVKSIDTTDIANVNKYSIGLKADTIGAVREGLYKVINGENGTGKRARVEGVSIAGKTGTAQNPLGRTHAWFSGFAPFENSKVCLVVFLEHGGKGGLEPSEMAKEIFSEAKARGYL
jgi:penicillin-binding protein 2